MADFYDVVLIEYRKERADGLSAAAAVKAIAKRHDVSNDHVGMMLFAHGVETPPMWFGLTRLQIIMTFLLLVCGYALGKSLHKHPVRSGATSEQIAGDAQTTQSSSDRNEQCAELAKKTKAYNDAVCERAADGTFGRYSDPLTRLGNCYHDIEEQYKECGLNEPE